MLVVTQLTQTQAPPQLNQMGIDVPDLIQLVLQHWETMEYAFMDTSSLEEIVEGYLITRPVIFEDCAHLTEVSRIVVHAMIRFYDDLALQLRPLEVTLQNPPRYHLNRMLNQRDLVLRVEDAL